MKDAKSIFMLSLCIADILCLWRKCGDITRRRVGACARVERSYQRDGGSECGFDDVGDGFAVIALSNYISSLRLHYSKPSPKIKAINAVTDCWGGRHKIHGRAIAVYGLPAEMQQEGCRTTLQTRSSFLAGASSACSTCSTALTFSISKAIFDTSSTASWPSNVRAISSKVAPRVSMKKK